MAFFDLGYPYFGQSQSWSPVSEGTGSATLGLNNLTRSLLEPNRLVMLDKVASLSWNDEGLRWLNHGRDFSDASSAYIDGNVPQSMLTGANALFGDGRVTWFNKSDFNLPPDGTPPNTALNTGTYASGTYFNNGAEWIFFPVSSRW